MEDIDYTNELPNSSQLEFKRYLSAIWKRKWLIILLGVITAIPFYRSNKNSIPIYRSSVLIKTNAFNQDEQDKILTIERQLEMRSRTFMEQVTARLGLALVITSPSDSLARESIFSEISTSKKPLEGEYEISIKDIGDYYLKMGENKVIVDSANVWEAIEKPRTVNGFTFRLNPQFVQNPQNIRFKIRPFEKAVASLNSRLNVEISRSGATMKIHMDGTNPDLLPDELNRIAEVYVEETKKLKRRDQDQRKKLLEQKLAAAESQVKLAEEALKNFNTKYPLSINAEKGAIQDRLATCQKYLNELPRQQQQLTELLDQVKKENEDIDAEKFRRLIIRQIANFAAMESEPQLAILRETLNEQEKRYDDYLGAYSKDFQPANDLRKKINETQEKILAFASRYRNTLAEMEAEYRTKYNEINQQLKNLPKDEYELSELQRNKDIADGFYNTLYSEYTQLSISDMVDSDQIATLDSAERPNRPINPSTKAKVVLGASLGFILGIIISIVWELLDKRLKTIDDIEKNLKLPALGAIPIINFKNVPEYQDFEKVRQIDKQLVTDDYSPTPIGEAYRALRTHLMFSKRTGKFQTLLITSISPEEGKSFTAGNLAIIVAQQKTNTLLVDADLRRGVLHNTFGLSKEPGFTNYLSNKVTLLETIQPTHIPNLSIISCGSMIPNPSELLGSLQLRRFLEEVRRKFDLVIFDTPPLDAATDAVVLGTQVDALAVVVRSGKTNRNFAREKLEVFRSVPANLVGVILNGSETALVNNYSYYHY